MAHEHEEVSFWKRFAKTKEGEVLVTPSSPAEITVITHFTPSKVELAFSDENAAIPVCVGNHDWFDIKIIPHGFILMVKINSNARAIQWKAIK